MASEMNTLKSLLFTVCTALLFSAGCAREQQFKAVEKICVPAASKSQAMETAENVLDRMCFAIDKSDADSGIIRTRPLPGAQFFEFWRSDNVGAFNSAEASLHTIRRTVQLNINQQDGQLCIDCNVKTQRLNLPERPLFSGAHGYEMFTRSSESMHKLKIHSEQKIGMAWIDLGRDSRLETEILKRIENRLAKTHQKEHQ